MAEAVRIAKQVVKGIPYLQKELGRRLSLQTGRVFATPSTYYVIFSGRCNLSCTFCTIWREVEPILTKEQMLNIVKQTKELSGAGYNISLSGGEPTIFKPLYETLEYAQKLGVNFGFTTNSLGLTKNNIQRILAYDPFNINVSLDQPPGLLGKRYLGKSFRFVHRTRAQNPIQFLDQRRIYRFWFPSRVRTGQVLSGLSGQLVPQEFRHRIVLFPQSLRQGRPFEVVH